jgi:hypothetical protein
LVFAHGGGLNSSGCHNQTSNSTYHCHSGPLDGQSFSSQEAAQAALDALTANKAPTVSINSAIRTVADSDGKAGEVVSITAIVSDSDGTIEYCKKVRKTVWLSYGLIYSNDIASLDFSVGSSSHFVDYSKTDN